LYLLLQLHGLLQQALLKWNTWLLLVEVVVALAAIMPITAARAVLVDSALLQVYLLLLALLTQLL
jgi:hypothetical protein